MPGNMEIASNFANLGSVAYDRGDLSEAERYWRRSVAMTEKSAPRRTFGPLINLGNLELTRGNYAAAEVYYRRALALSEQAGQPDSPNHAWALGALGDLARVRKDFDTADSYYQRALAVRRRLTPEGVSTAKVLQDLAEVEADRGNLPAAIALEEEALAMRMKAAPGGLLVATSRRYLGDFAERGNDLVEAEKQYLEAFRIATRLAPDTLRCATILNRLGRLKRRQKALQEAADYLRRAVDTLERQISLIGGTEDSHANYRATYREYYQDYVEVLIELGQARKAADVLERSRAQGLVLLLANRDLSFGADVPAELELRRRHANAEYDAIVTELSKLNAKTDSKQVEALLVRLQDARHVQQAIVEELRRGSPRVAVLRHPSTLDTEETRAILDGGTLLLSYSVGRQKSFLFAMEPSASKEPRVAVFSLSTDEVALREAVESYRNLLDLPASDRVLVDRSRSLYDALLRPAEPLIARYERILILPDGPLHTLPWAALVRGVRNGKPEYLVEWKPIHTAVSATVYAELKKERPDFPWDPAVIVAAFGDSKYPRLPVKKVAVKRGEGESEDATSVALSEEFDEVEDPQLRSVARGGFRFEPLPASREEVEEIARLYAPKSAAYLGAEATEERARAIGKDVPLIHYACHAVINERFPLDSALVFTVPEHPKEGQDNGLLQAWEIFEKVRIDADLVTLSACDSGLGKEMGGEGLIGLTRAFQYAGARSVLASLWKVEDKATGELMKRFYQYLKAGKAKDEALRLAQIDLIRSPEYSQPKDWAAFELNGDWK